MIESKGLEVSNLNKKTRKRRKESIFDSTNLGENFIKNKNNLHEETMKEYESIPKIEPKNNKVTDVLEFLNISSNFTLSSSVLLPKDFSNGLEFKFQAPYGYDMGEVNAFIERAKITSKEFLDIVNKRNEDVMTMATQIDRLQVDYNNILYENQILEGQSFNNDLKDNLEIELLEAKKYIKSLENKIFDDTLSKEKEILNEKIDLLLSENKNLKKELKNINNKTLNKVKDKKDFNIMLEDSSDFFEDDPVEHLFD